MTKIPPDDILEGLYKVRIREPGKLKTVLEFDNMDTHQKTAGRLLLRPILKFWSIGGYADEDHLGKSFQAMDFGLECQHYVRRLLWILHIGLVSVRLSSSEKSMKTLAATYLENANPIVVYVMSERPQQVSLFFDAAHAFSTWPLHFCHHSLWTFSSAVHQPDDVRMSTSPQTDNHSWSCSTSFLEDATYHRMNWCKFLWGNPCRAIETSFHWDSCLWDFWFSRHFSHSAAQKSSEKDSAVLFLHAYRYRGGNCYCILSHTARWLSTANNLFEFFVHAVLPSDSWPRRFFHEFHSWRQNS